MRGRGFWILALAGAAAIGSGATIAVRSTGRAQAQERGARGPARAVEKGAAGPGRVSVQDAMLRPFDLPFARETTLEEVRQHLARELGAPVVLDRAALDRLDLTPEDTVQLDLRGVRLKVGLKLLLGQVGLTCRVEAEDNLLILTDPVEGSDPAVRALAEIKELHRDLHDLQDAVDDLRDLVEEELGYEPETKHGHTAIVRAGARRANPTTTRRGIRG